MWECNGIKNYGAMTLKCHMAKVYEKILERRVQKTVGKV